MQSDKWRGATDVEGNSALRVVAEMVSGVHRLPGAAGLMEHETKIEKWLSRRYILWSLMVACWLIEGLSNRHTIVPDAVNYLGSAAACLKGNWPVLINGYWSPAYPALLTCVLFLFRPSIASEVVVVNCLQCAVLMGALAGFEYFLGGLIGYVRQLSASDREENETVPEWVLRATGYVLFFWATLYGTPPSLETPDALVFLLILVAAGILLRIACGKAKALHFAALGAVLGLSYLAKAVMFPMSFVFLAVAFFAVGNIRRAVPRLLLTVAVFLVVAGPFVLALSMSKGRFTFGDAGAINYAEFVNGVPFYTHWHGEPPGSGIPVHPTRRIRDTPPVYEFASPLGGTYPPSTDQSYWYEGVRPHFEMKGQLSAFRQTMEVYFELFLRLSGVLGVLTVLVICSGHGREYARSFTKLYFLWAPCAAALGLYSLVHVDLRFICAYILILLMAAFSVLRFPRSSIGGMTAKAGTVAIVLLIGTQLAWSVGHSILRLVSSQNSPALVIAQGLKRAGIEPGDRIACIGVSPGNLYWAHAAGVTIVAEVPAEGVPSFLAAEPALRAQTLSALTESGARAIIAKDLPASFMKDGWREISNTNYFIRSSGGLQGSPQD